MDWIPNTFLFPLANEEGEIVGTEERHTKYHARFTNDEKRELTRILKEYDPEKIDRFITLIADVCTDYMIFLQQRRNAEIKQVIESTLPALSDAQKALKQLNHQKFPLIEQLEKVGCPPDPNLNKIAYADIPILSNKAFEYLNMLIKALETIKPSIKRGRPQTEGGFSQSIADIFFEVFEENAPKSETGIMNDILSCCLEGMGLDCENPGRRLKAIRHK